MREELDVGLLGFFDRGHHVVRTGVVFAVTEDEQSAAAVFFREFFFDGIENRIVECGAQIAGFARARVRKAVGVLFVFLPVLHHLVA